MSNWTEEEREEALQRRLQGRGGMDEDAAAALGGGLRCALPAAPARAPAAARAAPEATGGGVLTRRRRGRACAGRVCNRAHAGAGL